MRNKTEFNVFSSLIEVTLDFPSSHCIVWISPASTCIAHVKGRVADIIKTEKDLLEIRREQHTRGRL
jgi:hypothetical protein